MEREGSAVKRRGKVRGEKNMIVRFVCKGREADSHTNGQKRSIGAVRAGLVRRRAVHHSSPSFGLADSCTHGQELR